MKSIVKVSEASKGQDVTERIAAYEKALEKMQYDLYGFIHSVFVHDKGEIRKTIEWYIDMLQFVHRREAIDVQKLLLPLTEEQREEIKLEVDTVLEYYKISQQTGAPPAERPVVEKTKIIAQPFYSLMKIRLTEADVEGHGVASL